MRISYEERKALMDRLGVDRLWSYSRLSTYLDHPWEYKVVYLERATRSSNVYTHFGTICHDIVQDMTDGKYPYEKMIELFDEKVDAWRKDNQGYTFPDKKIEASYINNLRHYFQTMISPKAKITNEIPVLLNLHDDVRDKPIAFFGYLDAIYTDEEGITHIVDYKTSSKSGFSGKGLKEKSKQLMLYACAISQLKKIPLEKINLRFDMMKYVNVWFQQKNGKMKSTTQERQKWVAGIEKKIRKQLVDLDIDFFEIDIMVQNAILSNSLVGLPKEVQDSYTLTNCYIDVNIDEEDAKILKEFLITNVRECEEKEAGDWEMEFPEPTIEEFGDFYWNVLSPQVRNQSLKWQENKDLVMKKNGSKAVVSAPSDDFFASLFAK